jgi:hypothetical protein
MGENGQETRKKPSRRWQFSIAAMLGVMTVAGLCAGVVVRLMSGPVTYPVEGRVVLMDGTPIQEGCITFNLPDLTITASSDIGANGKFILSTYDYNDGCPPGKYKVTVWDTVPATDQRYENVETTPLLVEVKRKKKNEFVIKLESAK